MDLLTVGSYPWCTIFVISKSWFSEGPSQRGRSGLQLLQHVKVKTHVEIKTRVLEDAKVLIVHLY